MHVALVTGASGFIGQHLVARLLRDGLTVRALVRDISRPLPWRQGVQVVHGDVRDAAAMQTVTDEVDTVFHLAAKVHDLEAWQDTGEHEAVTVQGTQNLLTAAGQNGVKRFLFLSSLSVYGADTQSMRDETAICVPVSAYGRAKLQAEQCVFEQGPGFGMHVCCLRPSMVYGRGCKGNLPRMIRMIDRGLFPPLPDLGNQRSVLHVANAVEAVLLAATHPAANGQSYIVTDEKAYSTRELYETICQGLEKRIPRWHVPVSLLKTMARIGDAGGQLRGKRFILDSEALDKLLGSAWYSAAKIARELGYCPAVTLADALPDLIQAYRHERAS